MVMSSRVIRLSILLIGLLLLVHCGSNTSNMNSKSSASRAGMASVDVNIWGEGTEIINSGTQLMDYPTGLLELRDGEHTNDSVLVIAIHGYQSRGYEWITGLKHLTHNYGSLFFYRYDWERCPDQVGLDLAAEIKSLAKRRPYKKVIVFAHSYGGLIATFAASQLGKLEAEIHVIAAPLSGFPQLLDQCTNLKYDIDDKLVYPEWSSNIHLIQHKTVHAQDGAFRDLASDPQDISLPFYQVQTLPPTMDGHRLGHNWSVTWVLDQHVGKPHRY